MNNKVISTVTKDLKHVRFRFNDVLPRDYIKHLEEEHCLLDEQAIKEACEHYFQGWEQN